MESNSNLRARSESARTFDASQGLYMLFWMFVFGSVLGFGVEAVWSRVRWGQWARRAGVVWGPFCQIYGIGVVAMYVFASLFAKKYDSPRATMFSEFIVCAIAGTLVEYFVSLFQQIGFGSVSWDYSAQPFNIGGRVSLAMMFVWGAVGLICLHGICPMMRALSGKISGRGGYIATWAMIAFMCVNFSVSAAAIGRWHDRSENQPPKTSLGAYIDQKYDDDRMRDLFPNMQFCAPGEYSYADHAA